MYVTVISFYFVNPYIFNRIKGFIAPVVDRRFCESKYKGVTSEKICMGVPDGRHDSCSGDDGGPAICYNGRGAWLTGIVSVVGCGTDNQSGIYTRTSAFIDWIRQQMMN